MVSVTDVVVVVVAGGGAGVVVRMYADITQGEPLALPITCSLLDPSRLARRMLRPQVFAQ